MGLHYLFHKRHGYSNLLMGENTWWRWDSAPELSRILRGMGKSESVEEWITPKSSFNVL